MNAIATTASSKSAIIAMTEDRSGVQVGEALTRRNTQVAVFLGIAMAERQLHRDIGSQERSMLSPYHSNFNSTPDTATLGHVVSLIGSPINIGIERWFGGKVKMFVSSTIPTTMHGNCIWHVASIDVDYAKVNTVEKAARLLQKLIVAAATPSANLLTA